MEAESNTFRAFQALIEHARDPILVLDCDTRVLYATPALRQTFGHSLASLHHTCVADLISVEQRERLLDSCGRRETAVARIDFDTQLRHADGTWRDVEMEVLNLLADPAVRGVVLTIRDVSSRRLADQALIHRALHDPLTGLPNRALLLDRLQQTLGRARRQRRRAAVLFLDLDNFKVVNDSMGHEAGDLLLTEISHRLVKQIRAGDTVARFGGDEFAVLLEDVTDVQEARASAQRILAALRQPIDLFGHELIMNASVGIALSSRRGARPEDLLRQADLAMYHAKAAGKGAAVVFTPAMQARADARLELEGDLRRALRRGELRVHYQPIVTFETRRLTGFEALVRWERPGYGLVAPGEFIPLAEETGLILPLGEWVLREACRQLREWRTAGAGSVTVAVNVSPRQLQDPGFVSTVETIIRETAIDPACLTLEITESVLVNDPEATAHMLDRIKSIGVRIAVDDFGTGYSSLSYLKRLPIDTLKIDQSFIKGLGVDGPDQGIVRGILDLARTLHLTTTAEGIETDVQLATLKRLGGKVGQGFLFGRPAAPEQLWTEGDLASAA